MRTVWGLRRLSTYTVTLIGIVVVLSALMLPVRARAAEAPDRLTSETMMVGGTERMYDLFVPGNYDERGSVHALALAFHGLYSTSQSLEKYVIGAASAYGMIVAFPTGIGQSWNAGGCCGSAFETGVDDVAFARQLAASLVARFHPVRVVAAGYSNGAMFSWYLACQPNTFVTGIVDAAGTEAVQEPQCLPQRRLMITAVHGRKDPVVPYNGGANPVYQTETGSKPFRAIPSVVQEWGHDHERCRSTGTGALPGWSATYWNRCPNGSTVTLFTIDGMGHDVPNYQAGYPVDFGTLIVDTAYRSR